MKSAEEDKGIRRYINALKKVGFLVKGFRFVFISLGSLPRKKKLVIFESFHARQYSDNPRAIYEYMKVHYPDYQLWWSVDKRAVPLFEKHQVPYIRRFTLKWFWFFPRAHYWVNNVRLPAWMPKPPGTVYIQTWHGTPLKKLGLDIEEVHMPSTETANYRKNFLEESRKWDFLVSPNSYSSEIFKQAFGYHGKVIESGYPRNDVLTQVSETKIQALRESLGIPPGKKIMLYAPTWRDNDFYEKGKYKFSFQFNLEKWKERYGDEWMLLPRMHYLIAENFDFSVHEGAILNVSDYPDIRDLYLISDLLITDYSSVFFDFAILNRPIIFFMYDLDRYRDQLRGFYFDIEANAPGPIVQTEQELFQVIDEISQSSITNNIDFAAFKRKFCSLEDGHATERTVKTFLNENK